MDVPSPWEFVLLALAAFRVARFVGWDDFPLVVRAREWATGEELTADLADADREPTYRRPTVAKLIECPWCQGFWVTLAVWGAWQLEPHATLVAAGAVALAAAVGLVAKNLDP